MKYFWTKYLPSYPTVLVYMLQDTEYRFSRYVQWLHRTSDFRKVMKRRTLEKTKKVKLLLLSLYVLNSILAIFVILLALFAVTQHEYWAFAPAGIIILLAPYVSAYGILLPLIAGWIIIQKRQEKAIIARARTVLENHKAIRIGVAGSYGKTTAKELLKAAISGAKRTEATPGNMNTPIGISRFARDLTGDEEVLIFELGEEKPGDVKYLAELTHPTIGLITGINEAHLQSFKTLDKTIETIYEIADVVPAERLYQNEESALVKKAGRLGINFSRVKVNGWNISLVETGIEGTSFVMKKGRKTANITTQLIGTHTVGVTAAVVSIADELGVSMKKIEEGLAALAPFEHRMEPRFLHGAWVIDDTYNGNSEGVQAGLALLKTMKANRRIYVTPGLVEQGSETKRVHEDIGEAIAKSKVDIAVLMKNSVTEHIKDGLERGNFKGLLLEIDNPLEFYTNLDQFVATGDVVLMQNDWTDNYN